MPQMAPLWWFSLFTMFILSFIIMWIIMYYQIYSSPKAIKTQKMTNKELNWKW